MTVARITLIALVVRLAAAPLLYLVFSRFGEGTGLLFDDEYAYKLFAESVTWSSLWPDAAATHPAFVYFAYVGGIAQVTGSPNLTVRLANGALSVLLVPVVAKLALGLGLGRKAALWAAWGAALSPGLVLASVSLTREWAVILAFTAAVLVAIQGRAWASFAAVSALTLLRGPLGLGLALLLLAWAVVARNTSRHLFAPALASCAAAGLVWVLIVAVTPDSVPASPVAYAQKYVDSESEPARRTDLALAHEGTFTEGSPIARGPLAWPTAATRTLLSPSPFWWPALHQLHAAIFFLPGLFWYALLPATVAGTWRLARNLSPDRSLVVVLAMGGLLATLTPWGLGIEPLRARMQLHGLLLVLGVAGLTGSPRVLRLAYGVAVTVYATTAMFYALGR